MDFTVVTRKEYMDFQVQDHMRPQLSPDDVDLWRLSLSHEFDRLSKFVESKRDPYKLPLRKRINISIALVFGFIGMFTVFYHLIKLIGSL